MAGVAAVFDLTNSLMLIDPLTIQRNLGKTQREDYPTNCYPVIAYDGSNILPTPWGYRSFFAVNNKLQKATNELRTLPSIECEYMFWYQSTTLNNIIVALLPDGIYITNSDVNGDWIKAISLTPPAVGLRKQWSKCVINNIVYIYRQGEAKFYAIVDNAKYADAATASPITGATRTQAYDGTSLGFGFVSYIPTFLNMSGQVGLFKAGNRLGFWDSDNSIAWSNNQYAEDFEPSVKTLAGATKFSDVVGIITLVIQHAEGFIIYAAKSITGVRPNNSETSKWSGSSILSDVGVLFDRQIAVAQPDNEHYAYSSQGLISIKNYTPSPIATDMVDYLINKNEYLLLDFIDSRYLILHTGNNWAIDAPDQGVKIVDKNGNEYLFPKPTYPTTENDLSWINDYLTGQANTIQDAFKNAEGISGVIQPTNESLAPCYDIDIFKSTWAETTFTPNETGTELLDSKLIFGATFLLENIYVLPVVTVNSVTIDTTPPGDWAGQDAADKLQLGVTALNNQLVYQQAWQTANVGVSLDYEFNNSITLPTEEGTAIWERQLIERRILPNCFDPRDLKVDVNNCHTELYFDKDRLAELLTYVEGEESVTFGYGVLSTGNDLYAWQNNSPLVLGISSPMYIIYPVLPDITAAVVANVSSYSGNPNQDFWYCLWAMYLHGDKCLCDLGTLPEIGEPIQYSSTERAPKRWDYIAAEDQGFYIRSSTGYNTLPSGAMFTTIPFDFTITGWHYTNATSGTFYAQHPTNPAFYVPINKAVGPIDPNSGIPIRATISAGDEYRESIYPGVSATQGTHKASFTVTHEFNLLPNFPGHHTVFDMRLSGYGYYPSGGFSFRKTHTISGDTICGLPLSEPGALGPIDYNPVQPTKPGSTGDGVKWNYPDKITLPPGYFLTRTGSFSPLNPVIKKSAVYDVQLEKWGIMENDIRVMCSLAPINRTDKTITPVHDYGMIAAVLLADGNVALINPNNTDSEICYGKFGTYRYGFSSMYRIYAEFGEPFTGQIIIETSIDGKLIAKELSLAVDCVNQYIVDFPFTLTGKWFNIRIRGNFALSGMQGEIEGTARR